MWLERFKSLGAIIDHSHIVYTSGKHGSTYVNKDALFPRVDLTSLACLDLAKHFQSHPIDVVIGPVTGGVILSQWVAHHLSLLTGKQILSVYAEKQGDRFILARGYQDLVVGKNVLVVEDVLNTGGSVKKICELLTGGTPPIAKTIVGVAALCNRGGVSSKDLGISAEIFSLISVQFEAFLPEECPLCKKGVPINTLLGKAKKGL